MEENIKEKTGKSVVEWVKLLHKQNFEKHGEMVKFLKTEHGFTHGYANYVALKAREADAASHDDHDLITSQYMGKEDLKPIFEAILKEVATYGNDIEVAPKKANVSLRRKTQFALVQPSTKTRVDLGLKISGKDPEGRLENSGPFGSMCTHRVQLSSLSDLDDGVKSWIREAYEAAG
jgi:predicted transport protein